MKKVLITAVVVMAVCLGVTYGRWLASDLLWLHDQRMAAEKQAAFVAGQQDAVRQIQQAQKGSGK